MRLSATRINTYLTCPRRYRYSYLDQIPGVPMAPVVFGRVMHQVLYALHQESMQQGAPLNLELGFAEFDQLWRKVLEEEQPLFKQGSVSAQEYWDLADDMLRRYVQTQQDVPAPLAVEYPFELPWQGHTLTGIIDRIDEVKDGLVIVDYKTSQRKPSAQDLKADLQVTLYALAIEQIFQQPVERSIQYHLRDQTLLSTSRTQEDFDKFSKSVLPRLSRTTKSSTFTPHYGYWCRFCEYRELCQAEGAPTITSEALMKEQAEMPTQAQINNEAGEQTGKESSVRAITPQQRRAVSLLISRLQCSEAEVKQLLQARFSKLTVEELSYAQAASLLLELQRKLRERAQNTGT